MNSFATLIEVQSLPKVTYYTVLLTIDGKLNPTSEFKAFQEVLESNSSERSNFNDLKAWLKVRIGEQKGALKQYFRNERKALALPPRHFDVFEAKKKNPIRLYCYRVNEKIVILFNGGVKLDRDPEKCPNVSKHFHSANLIAAGIKRAFESGDLLLNSDHTKIVFPNDLKIPL